MTIQETIDRLSELFDYEIKVINYHDHESYQAHHEKERGTGNYVGLYFGDRCVYLSRKDEDTVGTVNLDYTINYSDPNINGLSVEELWDLPNSNIYFDNIKKAKTFISNHPAWPKTVYRDRDGFVFLSNWPGRKCRKIRNVTKVPNFIVKRLCKHRFW